MVGTEGQAGGEVAFAGRVDADGGEEEGVDGAGGDLGCDEVLDVEVFGRLFGGACVCCCCCCCHFGVLRPVMRPGRKEISVLEILGIGDAAVGGAQERRTRAPTIDRLLVSGLFSTITMANVMYNGWRE